MDILNDLTDSDRKPAPASRRLLMRLADLLLPLAALWLLRRYHWPLPLHRALEEVNVVLVAFGFMLLFRLLFLLLTGATAGMWLSRIELLSGEERPLSFVEKLLAAGFVLYRGADYYLRERPPLG